MTELERKNYKLDPEYIAAGIDELKVSMKDLIISVNSRQQDQEDRIKVLENWKAGIDAVNLITARQQEQSQPNIDSSLLLKIILGLLAVTAAALGVSGTGVFK